MEADDLPYRAEYAKSGRAACRGCKGNIGKDSLRLATVTQSPIFDGKMTNWYHYMCFFAKQRPKSVTDIAHFDSLRWDDQKKITEKIENAGSVVQPNAKKGKSKKGGGGGALNDFTCEYAKSGRAACRVCQDKCLKGEIRIAKKDYESESAMRYGPLDRWHHIDCFAKSRVELEFFECGSELPGFNTLSAEDKTMIREKLPKIEGKRKADDEPDVGTKKLKKEKKAEDSLKEKQSKAMFRHRDNLKKLSRNQLAELIEFNEHSVPTGHSDMLDLLADMMTFGAMEYCDVCKNGSFVYSSGAGYLCKGNLTEWTRCANVEMKPKRKEFKIPPEYKEGFEFLKKYKFKDNGDRILMVKASSASASNGSMATSATKPLEGMRFVIAGNSFTRNKADIGSTIIRLGGHVAAAVDGTTAAVITTPDCLDSMEKKIEAAKELNIQCVSEDFLDEVEKGGALLMIQKKNIAPWGSKPEERIRPTKSSSKSIFKSESQFTKSIPDKMKMKLKGGAAVDPDSGLESEAHVYKRGDKLYSCALGKVDITKGTNSYYKLQILEADKGKSWWVFRSWGRIGTTIGGTVLDDAEDAADAVKRFEELYEEKTGNRFGVKEFKKMPHLFYPMEIDYGQDENLPKVDIAKSKSKLPKPVQHLISIVFDVEAMKHTMVEFEIDLKKMPLGKLSKRQIQDAYKVLSEASELMKLLESKEDVKEVSGSLGPVKAKLLDCSNRFFTLIPHDFGMNKPPILDNEDLIKAKIDMLDNLIEIEIAYSLLKSDGDVKNEDPIDGYYRKLKTKLGVLDESSDEYKVIVEYVQNTHAVTHSHYKLKVNNIFTTEREGEKKRFKPFKKLHNHKLLWHGSRLTNFAGILSQGLRIAPPEAPVTGYMFGKGVYFADMVSKSANYCCTSKSSPTGLLLLCDVALGDMYERNAADFITKLPSGKHSTKGCGKTCPSPDGAKFIDDGIEVPCGMGVDSEVKRSSLLYNEYIVYDVAQVNVRYLVETEFSYMY